MSAVSELRQWFQGEDFEGRVLLFAMVVALVFAGIVILAGLAVLAWATRPWGLAALVVAVLSGRALWKWLSA